jgi:hypothetical protein
MAAMARRGATRPVVALEYAFDRLLGCKLEQAYKILVPEQARATGAGPRVKEEHDEDGRDLRPGVLGPAEGGQHDCQPNGGTQGVRRRPRVRGT